MSHEPSAIAPPRSRRSLNASASFGVVLVTVAASGIWLGWRTQHYPFLNDFWPLLFQAGTFDWSKLESFRNGFFPPGYGVFLSLVGGKYVLAHAYYANLCFAIGTLVATYVATTRLTTPAAGVAAATLTAFYPINFSLMMTTGPDTGSVFMLWAAFCLVHVGGGQTPSGSCVRDVSGRQGCCSAWRFCGATMR